LTAQTGGIKKQVMTNEIWKAFEENDVTHSAAHHLAAVLELKENHGYARVTDVAKRLNITTGSASTNLKSLKGKGLVAEDQNRFLSLTPQGQALALAVNKRRRILERFFSRVLKVSKDTALVDACKTEHLISDETAGKLEKFVITQLGEGKSDEG
jgi:Mn-dependent DtxR family transcriptional regulator